MIVSRLKEEKVEVGFFFSLLIISIMIPNTIISMILIQIIMISVTIVLITIETENQVGILVNNVGILGPGNLPFLELDLAIVKVRCSSSRGQATRCGTIAPLVGYGSQRAKGKPEGVKDM